MQKLKKSEDYRFPFVEGGLLKVSKIESPKNEVLDE